MPLLLLFLVVLLTGCGAVAFTDHAATLQFEMEGYVAEATAIQQSARAEATQIADTVSAAETRAAHQRGVNAALYATVQAVFPPTQQIVSDVNLSGTPQAITEGRRWFVKTGMADAVRDTDGCVVSNRNEFSPTTSRIYATFKAYNIEQGTQLSVSWAHNGQQMHQESFQMERNANEVCLWFYIAPDIVDFDPGLWSVQLYADGFTLESAMPFTIVA